MFIQGVGTAVPQTRYKQSESDVCTRLNPRARAVLRKVLSEQNGIDARALAHDPPPGRSWMSSYGADFRGHGALLKVD